MCLRCSPPHWTSARGSPFCDACKKKYYLASSETGSSVRGTWGLQSDKEEDHCTPNKLDDRFVGGACCECPTGASCSLGSTIESIMIEEGYYRHSRATAQTFECKHPEEACAGTSTNPNSNDVERMRLEGDELCRVGFTGKKDGQLFNSSTTNSLIHHYKSRTGL